MKRKTYYILDVVDRKTGIVMKTETRRSSESFDRLWCKALRNVNPLQYKLVIRSEK